ncbi:MAG TPA: dihydrolipoamide acetyltransferase family protein [Terriglobales bacterium]|nr:dihydrolipoamide acetyltransferase family protein [Terriglobales bacterium]
MPVDVIMPQMGESIFEGTVTKWLKKPGDKVQRDEPLFEISTDKVDAEIPAPAAGVLKEIKIPEGKTVQVNTVVAVIDSDGAGAPAAAPQPAAAVAPPPRPAPQAAPPPPRPAPQAAPPPRPTPAPAPRAAAPTPAPAPAAAATVRSSPLVRRLARENEVDLAQVAGTGEHGRVSKRDILSYIEQRRAAPPQAAAVPAPVPEPAPLAPAVPAAPYQPGAVEIVPMSVMRKRIAEHMVMSKRTSPHVYSVFQADVSKIVALREKSKAQFEAAGTKLTFMPFFAQAAIAALKQFPIVNSSVQEESIVYKKDINLGIAVALDWGLIVPVIKHAEERNFLGLQRAINDLAERARTKRLSPDEVQDGTFTITNPGVFGGLFGLPIINQPQVAILGVGGIHKTPVVVDDAIAIRSIVHLTLSFDHRVVDGAVADQFLAAVVNSLENWSQPLL